MRLVWPAALALLGAVGAQTTNATCDNNATTLFLFNSAGESPCLVWSRLRSLCLTPTSALNVPPLPNLTFAYTPPAASAPCDCSAVSYALMAGCTWCQLGPSAYAFSIVREGVWNASCGQYASSGLGFAEDVVDIPDYAWLAWNGIASSRASEFAAYPTQTYATTLTRSFASTISDILPASTSSASSLSSSASTSSSPSTSSSHLPTSTKLAIVLSSTLGILVLVLVLVLWLHWRRRRARAASRPGVALSEKRRTSLDPGLFENPRAAPRPGRGSGAGSGSAGEAGWDEKRPSAESFESPLVVRAPSPALAKSALGLGPGLVASPSSYTPHPFARARDFRDSADPDFSRPPSDTDGGTVLPSFYEPSGAGAWTVRRESTRGRARESDAVSLASRYPPTEYSRWSAVGEAVEAAAETEPETELATSSEIGRALGSGRRVSWYARHELPPLPSAVPAAEGAGDRGEDGVQVEQTRTGAEAGKKLKKGAGKKKRKKRAPVQPVPDSDVDGD
ncbi:hypothetical protein Q5752_004868 [Cryptotrichosporon argae]